MNKVSELEYKSLKELEQLAADSKNYDAKFILGRALVEGRHPVEKKNEKQGLLWLKEAVNHGQKGAIEYMAYYDIKFEKIPNMKKIVQALEDTADVSILACNTLGELYLMQTKSETHLTQAYEAYKKAAEMGCIVGMSWQGWMLYHGKGVEKNEEKAIELLHKSARLGNSQAHMQLYGIFSEQKTPEALVKAYRHLKKAVLNGQPYFELLDKLYDDNITIMKEEFTKKSGLHGEAELKDEEYKNMHKAQLNELGKKYKNAAIADGLFKRANSFLSENQMWLISILKKYFVEKVLRFSHEDFIKAIKEDVCPLISQVGLFVLENYARTLNDKGKKDKKKQVQTAIDIITKILTEGEEYFAKPNKYYFMNTFTSKTDESKRIKRTDIPVIYKYIDYASPAWFKRDEMTATLRCGSCSKAEDKENKLLQCSACKQRHYCGRDCQKAHWKAGHKEECKKLQAAAVAQDKK